MSDIPACTANEIALGEAIALMEEYKAHAESLAAALEMAGQRLRSIENWLRRQATIEGVEMAQLIQEYAIDCELPVAGFHGAEGKK